MREFNFLGRERVRIVLLLWCATVTCGSVVAVEKDAMLLLLMHLNGEMDRVAMLLLLHLNREMDRVAMRVESSMCC